MARAFEVPGEQFSIQRDIIGDENRCRGELGEVALVPVATASDSASWVISTRGNVKLETCFLGFVLTVMRPCIISVSRLVMVRPSPVPPNLRVLCPATWRRPRKYAPVVLRNSDAGVRYFRMRLTWFRPPWRCLPERRRTRSPPGADFNLPLLGELQRIAHHVEQDLA